MGQVKTKKLLSLFNKKDSAIKQAIKHNSHPSISIASNVTSPTALGSPPNPTWKSHFAGSNSHTERPATNTSM